jgi:hypothetical protein
MSDLKLASPWTMLYDYQQKKYVTSENWSQNLH